MTSSADRRDVVSDDAQEGGGDAAAALTILANNPLYLIILKQLCADANVEAFLQKNPKALYRVILTLESEGKLLYEFDTPTSATNHVLYDIFGRSDFTITLVRLFQVFSNVWENGANSDSDNPNSLFNRVNPVLAWAFIGINFLSIVIGTVIKIYQLRQKQRLTSIAHLRESLKTIGIGADEKDDAKFDAGLKERAVYLANKKIDKDKKRTEELLRSEQWDRQVEEEDVVVIGEERRKRDEEYKQYMLGVKAKTDKGQVPNKADLLENPKLKYSSKYMPNIIVRAINWLRETIVAKALGKVYDYFGHSSFAYWLTWMPFVILIGLAAASLPLLAPLTLALPVAVGLLIPAWELFDKLGIQKSFRYALGIGVAALILTWVFPPLAPVLVILALGTGVGIFIAQSYTNVESRLKPSDPVVVQEKQVAETESEINSVTNEFSHQMHNARLRLFMNAEHEAFKEKYKVPQVMRNGQLVRKLAPKYKKSIAQMAREQGDEEAAQKSFDIRARIARKGQGTARTIVAAARGLIGGAVLFMFIGWFASVLVSVVGPLIGVFSQTASAALTKWLTNAADFLSGNALGGVGGGIIGFILGIKDAAQVHAEQLEHEKKVAAVLGAPYLRDVDKENPGKVMSKAEVFEILYAELERNKAKFSKDAIAALKKDHGYDISEIDVFNSEYFEKFQHNRGLLDRIIRTVKRVGTWVYEFWYGSQTGTFMSRASFLKTTGIFAGAIGVLAFGLFTGGAGLIAFGIAALVLTIGYGVLSVTSYQLGRNKFHNDAFLNQIDERIDYLEEKNRELLVMRDVLDGKQIEAAPDKEDKPRVVGGTDSIRQPAELRASFAVDVEYGQQQEEAKDPLVGLPITDDKGASDASTTLVVKACVQSKASVNAAAFFSAAGKMQQRAPLLQKPANLAEVELPKAAPAA